MYIITAQCRVFSFVINKKKETNTKASKALSLLLESLFHFKALDIQSMEGAQLNDPTDVHFESIILLMILLSIVLFRQQRLTQIR